MNEKRKTRVRRLLLAAAITGGAALGAACSDDSQVQGSIAQEGYDGGADGSDAAQGCDGCGLVSDDGGYDATGPDGFAGVAPGDAAYDGADDASDGGDAG